MKTIVLVGIVAFLAGYTVVDASKRLIRAEEVAQVGTGSNSATVSKFLDGEVTCYVTRHGTFGAHAISCVK